MRHLKTHCGIFFHHLSNISHLQTVISNTISYYKNEPYLLEGHFFSRVGFLAFNKTKTKYIAHNSTLQIWTQNITSLTIVIEKGISDTRHNFVIKRAKLSKFLLKSEIVRNIHIYYLILSD